MEYEGINRNAGLGWQIFNIKILSRLNETSSVVSDGTKTLRSEENIENDSSDSSGSVGLHPLPLWDVSNSHKPAVNGSFQLDKSHVSRNHDQEYDQLCCES